MAMISSVILKVLLMVTLATCTNAQLTANFYSTSCPSALPTIRRIVVAAIAKEARMGASLLRLHFHDCFVGGCDGSVLLDETPTLKSEKTAIPNNNSIRGFEVIDQIKTAVDQACGGRSVVSCADILAIAARDSVNILGGPSWDVPLGRRDSTTAFLRAANNDLPSPFSGLSALIRSFKSKGLDLQDLVALSGSHTIGQAKCSSFKDRIRTDTNIDSTFATSLQANCPSSGGDDNLAPLDQSTPCTFDNAYFTNLLSKKGLLHSDQELFSINGAADATVQAYSNNPSTFERDFVAAMVKMSIINPLTGTTGQVRLNCRKIN